jgi:hypothetical protein
VLAKIIIAEKLVIHPIINGYYYFHDVIQNGKYKIKICNILDGYFNLKMPSPSGEVY